MSNHMDGQRSQRNWTSWIALALVFAYAVFVQSIWGWGTILSAWRQVGFGPMALALALLVATYFVRAHRIQDYFQQATAGRFLRVYRVTQIHNLLNIMLPMRSGEVSFPLLMRSEFGVPVAHGASALLILRLLDLHALLAAGAIGLVARDNYSARSIIVWLAFAALPLVLFRFRDAAFDLARRLLPDRFAKFVDQAQDGIPKTLPRFLRAWALTALNWGVKVAVLAWVLGLMGVQTVAACFGGALGGELSSVLPVHAPGGIGTYPAAIAAGAAALGGASQAAATLATAAINTHLLMVVSALAGTGLALFVRSDASKTPASG